MDESLSELSMAFLADEQSFSVLQPPSRAFIFLLAHVTTRVSLVLTRFISATIPAWCYLFSIHSRAYPGTSWIVFFNKLFNRS